MMINQLKKLKFADFIILASKVNDENKNRKKEIR